jgi:dTDP-4-amino-4,6-dideoxygalactose transaminase
MAVPLLDLKRQYNTINDELESKIIEVARSGMYIKGPYVEEFEAKVADYLGVKHAIGVSNGTMALQLALEALGVKHGDEVITTPFSFFASSEVIARLGAKPIFVDVELDTMNIDVNLIEKAITRKTKAIMPVHIFGHAVDMDPIMAIAEKHNIAVVEDACQSIGSKYKDKKNGNLGHAAGFSFYPTKNLGAFGDGGLVTTNSDETAQLIIMLRDHGSTRRYYNDIIGYNSRLDAIQAAIMSIKLDHLDEWNEGRRKNANYYNEAIKAIDGVIAPIEEDYAYHSYHQYTIRIVGANRDDVSAKLKNAGIGHLIYYPIPLHLQKAHSDLGFKSGDLPNAEHLCNQVLSLPIFSELTTSEMDEVIERLRNAL